MVIPMSVPALISAFTIEFVYIWNDFLWPLILTPRATIEPVTLAILLMSSAYTSNWGVKAAGGIIVSLPPLILFIVLQKYFIKGILGGTVIKG
jgi:ABC-type glycerol-3-phosphate transport system permease component